MKYVKNLNDLTKIADRYDMKLYYKPDYEYHIKENKILKTIIHEIYGMAVDCEFRNEKIERGTIGMSSDGILHAVYELIRVRFAEKFNEHISFNLSGWILAPYISEDTEVIISSNRRSDIEWLQREKETIQEMKRQKKGLQ